MVGRYRALLIGNSTYPADEHNLQALKGPVKDIAALNRALADPGTGLFDDADVTLLPEATSARAIRALGRFFGTATRDEVLLVYFSGHGKLDQSGRLHLCMQDTDSTDLLSTAVSSTRINEFADASHARNIVIVLDCCHAGAFRGADLGQAVAGPGRYVLASCRGTQLANDATLENGTSFFTQHLVDGLLRAAADHDQDGYVTFSDLYAYVDRRLRETGKQIPQQRVDADGELPLARRPPPAPKGATPPGPGQRQQPEPAPPVPAAAADAHASAPVSPARTRPRRRVPRATVGAAVAVAVALAAIITLELRPGGSGANPGSGVTVGSGTYVATGPWRLKMDDQIQGNDNGCTITLISEPSGTRIPLPADVYGTISLQIHQTGSFRWQVSNSQCLVAPQAGPGTATLPLVWTQAGDSDGFALPSQVAVQVKDYNGSPDCLITLRDPASGQVIDFKDATKGAANDTVVLVADGHPTAYLSDLTCKVKISPAL